MNQHLFDIVSLNDDFDLFAEELPEQVQLLSDCLSSASSASCCGTAASAGTMGSIVSTG